jgi:hypothetical protein
MARRSTHEVTKREVSAYRRFNRALEEDRIVEAASAAALALHVPRHRLNSLPFWLEEVMRQSRTIAFQIAAEAGDEAAEAARLRAFRETYTKAIAEALRMGLRSMDPPTQ